MENNWELGKITENLGWKITGNFDLEGGDVTT